MKRMLVLCEGQSESNFVKNILAPHFAGLDIALGAPILGTPGHKGGNVNFQRVLFHVRNLLREDGSAIVSTFFDFYGIDSDFPGYRTILANSTTASKHAHMAASISEAVKNALSDDARRFVPYLQMYEFEGLLFSVPRLFAEATGQHDLANVLESICADFATPEDINDSQHTAPSKRILAHYRTYDKVTDGLAAARAIGLPAIRQACPLFNQWLTTIEGLGED